MVNTMRACGFLVSVYDACRTGYMLCCVIELDAGYRIANPKPPLAKAFWRTRWHGSSRVLLMCTVVSLVFYACTLTSLSSLLLCTDVLHSCVSGCMHTMITPQVPDYTSMLSDAVCHLLYVFQNTVSSLLICNVVCSCVTTAMVLFWVWFRIQPPDASGGETASETASHHQDPYTALFRNPAARGFVCATNYASPAFDRCSLLHLWLTSRDI